MLIYKIPVLAVLNQKGGVGKTTVSSILAEYSAVNMRLRVLVVDLDVQCNSSDYWVGMETAPGEVGGQLPPPHPDYDGDQDVEERSTIADVFFGKSALPYSTYIDPANGFKGKVEILLGHPKRLELINSEQQDGAIGCIGAVLHQEEMAQDYDLVILDTGPSRNTVFRAALRAATHVVVPFEPEEKSLQGINAMIQAITSEDFSRNPGDAVRLLGLLPNKVRLNTNIHAGTLEMLREELSDLLSPTDVYLPLSTAFPERDIKGVSPKSIFQINRKHKGRIHAEAVGKYMMGQVMKDPRFNQSKDAS